MQLPFRKTNPHARQSGPLIGFALVVLLSTLVGCADDADTEDETSPSPVAALPSHQATRLLPPEPIEPPNPATHRPPMDNPGGLNRFRPERPVPGLK